MFLCIDPATPAIYPYLHTLSLPSALPILEDEVGDLLFVVVNLARHLHVDPESALRRTNAKFERRFRAMEAALAACGEKAEDQSLDTLEELWQAAKRAEREG